MKTSLKLQATVFPFGHIYTTVYTHSTGYCSYSLQSSLQSVGMCPLTFCVCLNTGSKSGEEGVGMIKCNKNKFEGEKAEKVTVQ